MAYQIPGTRTLLAAVYLLGLNCDIAGAKWLFKENANYFDAKPSEFIWRLRFINYSEFIQNKRLELK